MSEASEWAIVALTAVLSAATFLLAYHTSRLVKTTKEISEKDEALKIMPVLTFYLQSPISDSKGDARGEHSRFGVRNIGNGHAKNPKATARVNGKEMRTNPLRELDFIETDNPFHWDVFGVKVGDKVEVEIEFTDIKNKSYPAFKHSYTAN